MNGWMDQRLDSNTATTTTKATTITKSSVGTVLTSPQEFAFRVGHGFNHVFPITRIKEKLSTFSIGNKLNKIGVPTDREKKVKFVDTKHASKVQKGYGGIILEFERV
jgi:hypothetical protein